MTPSDRHSPTCHRKRLAEGGVVVVDACDCGVLSLHFGAITLRMAPCAVADLVATLNHALAAREPAGERGMEGVLFASERRRRGEA